jgi:hypothetical protein
MLPPICTFTTPPPQRRLRPISGFDLLANPRVTINDIIPAIPALGTIDPQLLARVEIDGASPLYVMLLDSP